MPRVLVFPHGATSTGSQTETLPLRFAGLIPALPKITKSQYSGKIKYFKEGLKISKPAMVTRTIESTKATILCLNVETGTPENKEVVLSGTFKDNEAILKSAKKVIETETLKAVHVNSATVETALYGMSEQEFIAVAKILGEGRKSSKEDQPEATETPNA